MVPDEQDIPIISLSISYDDGLKLNFLSCIFDQFKHMRIDLCLHFEQNETKQNLRQQKIFLLTQNYTRHLFQ